MCVESSKKKVVKVKRDGLPDMMLCEYLSNCINKMVDIYEDKPWNSESITKSNGLYNSMININTQFIMSLLYVIIQLIT